MLVEILGNLHDGPFLVFARFCTFTVVTGLTLLVILNLWIPRCREYFVKHTLSRTGIFVTFITILCLTYFLVWMFHYNEKLIGLITTVGTLLGIGLTFIRFFLKMNPSEGKKKYELKYDLKTFVIALFLVVILLPGLVYFTGSHFLSHYMPRNKSVYVKTIINISKLGKVDKKLIRSFSFESYTRSGDDANGLGLIYYKYGRNFKLKAYKAFEIACKKHMHADGCANFAWMIYESEGKLGTKKLARDLLQQSCNDGSADGCFYYTMTFDDDVAVTMYEKYLGKKACKELKSSRHCQYMANSLSSTKRYDQRFAYTFLAMKYTHIGSDEYREANIALADFLKSMKAAGVRLSKKHSKILAEHLNGCVKPHSHSLFHRKISVCFLKAALYRDGWFGKPNKQKAYAYFRKACLRYNKEACLEIYGMVKNGSVKNISFAGAERLRKYTCQRQLRQNEMPHPILCEMEYCEYSNSNNPKTCKLKKKLALRTKH